MATVIPEDLAIRSQPSASAPVVKSLTRGQSVAIDLRVTGPEGAWCRIREPGLQQAAGYALCSQLAEQQPSRPRPVILPPAAPQQPAPPAAKANVVPLGDLDSWFTPEFWSGQLELSPEQRKATDEWLANSGVTACRDDLVQSFRRYGVSDSYSFLKRLAKAARNPFGDSFIVVNEPKIERGAAAYRAFWEAFGNLLTPDQKARAASDPRFQLLLVKVRSDPADAFQSYVMRYMERRSQ